MSIFSVLDRILKFGGKKYRLVEMDSDPDRQALDADPTGSTFGYGSQNVGMWILGRASHLLFLQ